MPSRFPRWGAVEPHVDDLARIEKKDEGLERESVFHLKRAEGARAVQLSSFDGVCDLLQAKVNALKNEDIPIEEDVVDTPAHSAGTYTMREWSHHLVWCGP